MSLPSFSIIIPAYNEEKYLPLCLDSVNKLNYPKDKFEVIVVDNGSTDRTREIAQSYGTMLFRDNSMNVSGLRNLGARQARGDILAFVDADCVVSKDWLKYASKYFDSPDIVAWGSPAKPPGKSTWVQRTWYLVRHKSESTHDVHWLETMNLFVLKDNFTSIGGFNEKLVTCEDVDFCYRINKYGRIVSDNKLTVIHYGEAKTIKEFIKKEIWRGAGNLRGILSHGLSLRELPSLSVPIYFGLFLSILIVVVLFHFTLIGIMTVIILYLIPSFAVLYKLRAKNLKALVVFQLLFIIQIYFFSRTLAVLKSSSKYLNQNNIK